MLCLSWSQLILIKEIRQMTNLLVAWRLQDKHWMHVFSSNCAPFLHTCIFISLTGQGWVWSSWGQPVGSLRKWNWSLSRRTLLTPGGLTHKTINILHICTQGYYCYCLDSLWFAYSWGFICWYHLSVYLTASFLSFSQPTLYDAAGFKSSVKTTQ